MKKIFLTSLLCCTVLPVAAFMVWVASVDNRFERYQPAEPFYSACNKVWAHRGYFARDIQRNSIDSVNRALAEGAPGSELDVFYDHDLDKFVVSHNRPYAKRNGALLLLEDVFASAIKPAWYWLDFKNLAELQGERLAAAVKRLQFLLASYQLQGKVTVESTMAEGLAAFKNAGIDVTYWLMPAEGRNNPLVFRWLMTSYKSAIMRYGFSSISMSFDDVGEKTEDELAQMHWHLFYINDIRLLEKFTGKSQVRIVLTDSNAFGLNSCDSQGEADEAE